MRLEPIWVARRMRWLSPPERVAAERLRVRYSSPTLRRNPQPGADLLEDAVGDHGLGLRQRQMVYEVQGLHHALGGQLVDVDAPHGDGQGLHFQPLPWQAGQGHWDMHSSSSRRLASDWVSL